MECDICSRTSSSNLPFHCITCARNVIYGPRLEATRLLLEKESLAKRIEKAVNTRPTGSEKQDKKSRNEDIGLSQAWCRETTQARKVESEGKTGEIEKHILTLREEIQNARDEISKRKAALERRKKDVESIRTSLPGRRTAVTNRLADSMRKGSQSWSGINIKSINTRAFLCREAALLYRLRQRKKAKGAVVIDQFSIGGLPIVDLKELNSKSIAPRGISEVC
jgi:hypothetical protein